MFTQSTRFHHQLAPSRSVDQESALFRCNLVVSGCEVISLSDMSQSFINVEGESRRCYAADGRNGNGQGAGLCKPETVTRVNEYLRGSNPIKTVRNSRWYKHRPKGNISYAKALEQEEKECEKQVVSYIKMHPTVGQDACMGKALDALESIKKEVDYNRALYCCTAGDTDPLNKEDRLEME